MILRMCIAEALLNFLMVLVTIWETEQKIPINFSMRRNCPTLVNKLFGGVAIINIPEMDLFYILNKFMEMI